MYPSEVRYEEENKERRWLFEVQTVCYSIWTSPSWFRIDLKLCMVPFYPTLSVLSSLGASDQFRSLKCFKSTHFHWFCDLTRLSHRSPEQTEVRRNRERRWWTCYANRLSNHDKEILFVKLHRPVQAMTLRKYHKVCALETLLSAGCLSTRW